MKGLSSNLSLVASPEAHLKLSIAAKTRRNRSATAEETCYDRGAPYFSEASTLKTSMLYTPLKDWCEDKQKNNPRTVHITRLIGRYKWYSNIPTFEHWNIIMGVV